MTPELIERRNRERIATLDPAVQAKFSDFVVNALAAGKPILITDAKRGFFEQELLYKCGRDKNGNVVKKSEIKTNARAGMSWHNFGRAVDCCFVDPTGNPTWEGPWDALGEIGEACGLEWAGRWTGSLREQDHFQDREGATLIDLCSAHVDEINEARAAAAKA